MSSEVLFKDKNWPIENKSVLSSCSRSAAFSSSLCSLQDASQKLHQWPISHDGSKVWKCQTSNPSCARGVRDRPSSVLMCHYLCIWQTAGTARSGCVQIIEMSDYLQAKHWAEVHVDARPFVFTSLKRLCGPVSFLSLLPSPLCRSRDLVPCLGMNGPALDLFLFCPHNPSHGGSPWSVSMRLTESVRPMWPKPVLPFQL